MMELPFSASIGVPTFDIARYSSPPSAIERVEVFAGPLYVFEFPRMESVQAVDAPVVGGDVMIHINEAMPRLECVVATEMPTRSVRARSLVLIPDGLATSWHAPTGQPQCIHIHVPRALREAWAEEMGAGPVRPLVNASTPEIEGLFARIGAELRGNDAFRRLKLQGLALAAVAAGYRLGGLRSPRAPSQAMTPARLRRVRAYVEENLDHEVCLEDMAGCVGLSPSHFSRAFKAETGQSPYAFVVQARVARVKEQLLSGRATLADIAMDCGFAS